MRSIDKQSNRSQQKTRKKSLLDALFEGNIDLALEKIEYTLDIISKLAPTSKYSAIIQHLISTGQVALRNNSVLNTTYGTVKTKTKALFGIKMSIRQVEKRIKDICDDPKSKFFLDFIERRLNKGWSKQNRSRCEYFIAPMMLSIAKALASQGIFFHHKAGVEDLQTKINASKQAFKTNLNAAKTMFRYRIPLSEFPYIKRTCVLNTNRFFQMKGVIFSKCFKNGKMGRHIDLKILDDPYFSEEIGSKATELQHFLDKISDNDYNKDSLDSALRNTLPDDQYSTYRKVIIDARNREIEALIEDILAIIAEYFKKDYSGSVDKLMWIAAMVIRSNIRRHLFEPPPPLSKVA